MFAFRNQPFRDIYLNYFVVSLWLRYPIWALCALVPAWRPRPTWSYRRTMMVYYLQSITDRLFIVGSVLPVYDPEEGKKHAHKPGFTWVEPLSKKYLKGEVESMATVNKVESVQTFGYWYGGDMKGSKAQSTDKVMYHFHSGGYIMRSADPKGTLGPAITAYAKKCAKVVDKTFCLDYRLAAAAPFEAVNPFPAQLIDALAGYQYLVETLGFKPRNIILSGDSAGGHLALALARYLIQESIPNLPPPGAVIIHSPNTDWACTHNLDSSSSLQRNACSDFGGKVSLSGYPGRALCGSLPEGSVATNTWISPSSLLIETRGLFADFPQTLVTAGGAEQLVDEIRTLVGRLRADNDTSKIKYVEYPEATHNPLFSFFLEPERTQGLQMVTEWLETIYASQ